MRKKSTQILGQNARNLLYIKGEEFGISKRLADSKLKTKKFMAAHGVAVPETFQIIKSHSEIDIEAMENFEPPFVVKPNNGYGGKGIIIIESKNAQGNFVSNAGKVFSPKSLAEHFNYVLDGFFSLSGGRDKVIIEKKVTLMSEIELLGTFGLPDIRVIVYNSVPVMAMMRIPTKESDGKANIHSGACAAGIDIGSGKLTYVFHHGKSIKSIPGIGDIRGIVVPDWEKILRLAVQVQKAAHIKFLGCDIVLDDKDGPLLLEMNVRPGLEIQNVNRAPLRLRLDKVEGVEVKTVEKGVRIGRDLFSGDVEERIKNISGKKVLGHREYLRINYGDKIHNYIADISLSQVENAIDRSFVQEVLKIDIEGKTRLRLDTELEAVKRPLRFDLMDLGEKKILLGKNSLRGFLVDPFKYKKGETPIFHDPQLVKGKNIVITKSYEQQLRNLDAALHVIDSKLLILKYLKPLNYQEQLQKFLETKGKYIPKFTYQKFPHDLDLLERELRKIDIPEIPGAEIFARKQEEVRNKIFFLRAFQDGNSALMTKYSGKLYGAIGEKNLEISQKIMALKPQLNIDDEEISYEEIEDMVKKFNHIYGIKLRVKQAEGVARFVVSGDILRFRRGSLVGKREMRSIIAHEIEGHYLRKINGRKSDFSILASGTAGYLEIDEGIAIHNQARFVHSGDQKYYSIYERYYFLAYALKYSYRKFIEKLTEYYDGDYEKVFRYMLRVKRGFRDVSDSGAFMKDAVYVNGFLKVEEFLESGRELQELYIGKVGLEDLKDIESISVFSQHKREIIVPFLNF